MRIAPWLLACTLAAPLGLRAQEVTGAERTRVLAAAREHYYSLTGQGVRSFTCAVNFDLGTVSRTLLPPADAADRHLLDSVAWTLKVTPSGPKLEYRFPEGVTAEDVDVVSAVTVWVAQLVGGFFQVWPVLGFAGPVPPDKQVRHAVREGDTLVLSVKTAAGDRELRLDGKGMLLRVLAENGRVDTRPEFRPLTFTGGPLRLSASTTTEYVGDAATVSRYTVDSAMVDGVTLPQTVHLTIGTHVDVHFGLSGCTVQRR